MAYLSSLIHFTLAPASNAPAFRLAETIYILLYSIGSITQSPGMASVPTALVFAVFFTHLFWPSSPLTLYLVLLALALLFIQFQIPINTTPPSPLLLFAPKHTLLLCSLSIHQLEDAFLPSVLFFGPLALISMIILSLSLDGGPPIIQGKTVTEVWTPYPSRLFYSGAILALLLMIILLFATLLFKRMGEGHISDGFNWSKYGVSIERHAKRRWSRIVAHWSITRTMIPPPLNILYFLYKLIARLIILGR